MCRDGNVTLSEAKGLARGVLRPGVQTLRFAQGDNRSQTVVGKILTTIIKMCKRIVILCLDEGWLQMIL